MLNKTEFVAALFVMALCGFVAGGIGLYKVFEYQSNGQEATMQLADPDKKVVAFEDTLSVRTVDVMYVSDAGNVVVPNKLLPDDLTDRLFAGEGITVTYLTNRPERVFYYGQRPQVPWGWLIIGLIALPVAIYALKLRKREAAGHSNE
ncbi:MAG: hypothetical protein ACR2QR_08465 [Woeseiaceae bacterium]